ncbi:MAG: glycosyltransferase [Bacteroidota bacterium]
MERKYNITILGLTITSSRGNGHATTYRGLVKALKERGHSVTFLERNTPWNKENRDLQNPEYCRVLFYDSLEELKDSYTEIVREADLTMVGSYVPEGAPIGEWVTANAERSAFYDIDTPVTLQKLKNQDYEYLHPSLIRKYNAYLSFTGGKTLRYIEDHYSSPMARPLYCSFDPAVYYQETEEKTYDMGYLGTYSDDRQPALKKLLIEPAAQLTQMKFAVAGPQYPENIKWGNNVRRIEHLSPDKHRGFYNSQRFTLNVTRQAMIQAGYSPSVRLFEAAACATPIISDYWDGIDIFFKPNKEVLIARSGFDIVKYLRMNEEKRILLGKAAQEKVLSFHTGSHRAQELEGYIEILRKQKLKALL